MLTPPRGLAAIKQMFGDFKWVPHSPPSIDIDDTWERDNLVRLRNVCGTGLAIQLHRLVADPFQEALAAATKSAPNYKIRLLGGFCARQMKLLDPKKQPTAPLSTHSWGIAFDVNWDKNPLSPKLITDIPSAFVAEFTKRGWDWGGAWRTKRDPMHFQMAVGY